MLSSSVHARRPATANGPRWEVRTFVDDGIVADSAARLAGAVRVALVAAEEEAQRLLGGAVETPPPPWVNLAAAIAAAERALLPIPRDVSP